MIIRPILTVMAIIAYQALLAESSMSMATEPDQVVYLSGPPKLDRGRKAMRSLLCGGFAAAAGTCGVTDTATHVATVVLNTPQAVMAGQFSAAQKSLGPAVLQVMQGDPGGAVATLSDAEIQQAQQRLGTIAEAVPGYSKLNEHCNGFICNAGPNGGTTGVCDDNFLADARKKYCEGLPAAQCRFIKGKKIDYKQEIGAAADVVGASLASGPVGGAVAAAQALQSQLLTQFQAFQANAGPIATSVINDALNNIGRTFTTATQCGMSATIKVAIMTSSGKQCAFCLCAPTANAFTPYLAWKLSGSCAATVPPL